MSACDVPPMFIVPTPPPSSKLGIALRRGSRSRGRERVRPVPGAPRPPPSTELRPSA